MTEGYRKTWRELSEAGIEVRILQDTPTLPFLPDECLAWTPDECIIDRNTDRSGAIETAAAQGLKSIRLVDMGDFFCPNGRCPLVIGNLVVWRDRHHMTRTYSRALAPFLAEKLDFDQKP